MLISPTTTELPLPDLLRMYLISFLSNPTDGSNHTFHAGVFLSLGATLIEQLLKGRLLLTRYANRRLHREKPSVEKGMDAAMMSPSTTARRATSTRGLSLTLTGSGVGTMVRSSLILARGIGTQLEKYCPLAA